jgi:CubicO group peptidase (beta-lactamase class C family)
MKREYWPTEDWQSADPASLGMKAEMLSTELVSAIQSDYSNVNGLIVVRKGAIAFEKYFNGYGPDDAHHMTSVTKSVISALIGIAIHTGYIENVDQKVLDFFPEYSLEAAEGQKKEIAIRHLLTMTAPYPYKDWQEPLDKLSMQADWAKFALDMLGQGGEIGKFKYSTAGAHLLSAIISRSTGMCAREFANKHLFKPTGMREIPDPHMQSFEFEDLFGKKVKGWINDPKGISTGGWGLTLRPRDMARFGFLYLKRGKWDDKQIIPEAWVAESTAMNPYRYGYLWWLREEDGIFSYAAIGDGGNLISVIPEKDLVIAIASAFIPQPRDRWGLIKEHILPAVLD